MLSMPCLDVVQLPRMPWRVANRVGLDDMEDLRLDLAVREAGDLPGRLRSLMSAWGRRRRSIPRDGRLERGPLLPLAGHRVSFPFVRVSRRRLNVVENRPLILPHPSCLSLFSIRLSWTVIRAIGFLKSRLPPPPQSPIALWAGIDLAHPRPRPRPHPHHPHPQPQRHIRAPTHAHHLHRRPNLFFARTQTRRVEPRTFVFRTIFPSFRVPRRSRAKQRDVEIRTHRNTCN